MSPSDIAAILTAVAPIATSVCNTITANNKSVESPNVVPEKTVNVTINNHFYTNSEADALQAANQIQNQVVNSVTNPAPVPNNRYII